MVMPSHAEQLWSGFVSALAVLFTATCLYLIARFLRAEMGRDEWKGFIKSYFVVIYGVPSAAMAAFCVVEFFGITTPGPLELSLWGLELKGPAGGLSL